MLILAERVIAVLKANTSLVSYIGSASNIFIANAGLNKDKYIVVGTEVGKDLNYAPVEDGDIFVEAVVRRDVVNAESVCLELAKKINDILNRSELTLTNSTYFVKNFIRVSSSGLEFDTESQEYYYRIVFNYFLSES